MENNVMYYSTACLPSNKSCLRTPREKHSSIIAVPSVLEQAWSHSSWTMQALWLSYIDACEDPANAEMRIYRVFKKMTDTRALLQVQGLEKCSKRVLAELMLEFRYGPCKSFKHGWVRKHESVISSSLKIEKLSKGSGCLVQSHFELGMHLQAHLWPYLRPAHNWHVQQNKLCKYHRRDKGWQQGHCSGEAQTYGQHS